MTDSQLPSEQVLDAKWDQCVADLLVKAGIGFSSGVVVSALLFRRRTWPVWAGTGFGTGYAYSDCQRRFRPAGGALATLPVPSLAKPQ